MFEEKTQGMVDMVTWSKPARVVSDEGVLKTVLGAVQKTLDRRTLSPLRRLVAEPSPAGTAEHGHEIRERDSSEIPCMHPRC